MICLNDHHLTVCAYTLQPLSLYHIPTLNTKVILWSTVYLQVIVLVTRVPIICAIQQQWGFHRLPVSPCYNKKNAYHFTAHIITVL